MINYNNLKIIARNKIKKDSVSSFEEFEEFLKQWWSDKYRLPDNHPLLLEKNLEDLIIEYFVDYFRNNPQNLNEFEINNNLIEDDEDEIWFKKKMGDQYTPRNSFSSDYVPNDIDNVKKEETKGDVLIDEEF